jgi:hypothetical protein
MTGPRHTVIYTHGGGRLGNQIVRFAHWLAWARQNEGEVAVLNHSFWPFARYFARWSAFPACRYPAGNRLAGAMARAITLLPVPLRAQVEKHSRLPRLVHRVGPALPGWQRIALDVAGGEMVDLAGEDFLATVRARRVTVCSGWRFACWPWVARQRDTLRPFFALGEPYREHVAGFLADLRGRYEILAGLLVRQSDYRTWAEGRFFHPSSVYAGWIRQILDLHPGRRVGVVIASEEAQDPAVFAGLPCHFAPGCVGAGGHWFENFAALSACDFVASVPSTFAATAAWIGGVPLWPLIARDQILAPGQMLADALADAAAHPEFAISVK